MAETTRTGSSQEGFGAETRSSSAGAESRSAYPAHDGEARRYVQRNENDERRRRRTADLFFEDSIVLLGILLGGAAGYVAATTVRGSSWSSTRTRRPSERRGFGQYFSQQGQARASSSVAKDETTDLIASNKVEGTAVYNR